MLQGLVFITDTAEYTGNRCRPRSLVMGADLEATDLEATGQYLRQSAGVLEEHAIQDSS